MDPLTMLTQWGPLIATGAGAVIAGGIRQSLGKMTGTMESVLPRLADHSDEIKEHDRLLARLEVLPDQFMRLEKRNESAHNAVTKKLDKVLSWVEAHPSPCPLLDNKKGVGGGGH